MEPEVTFSVSDFVAVFNQTIEYVYPNINIVGELANFRISKNRWVYFDLKDDESSVKFFGTIYNLPGPLENGMMLQVRGTPKLHQLYGFSVNVQTITPVGEGSLKKAAALLQAKLEKEGLFDPARKRPLPYPPKRVGLIGSKESAAYADFIKILDQRWGGLDLTLCDVQVQGEAAVPQIVAAIAQLNSLAEPPEVIVITRGGGSADDLGAFSTEQVTRAVAASRIPTLVAIGHEIDLSLAELAADQRASTPSNAAELLTPDRTHELKQLKHSSAALRHALVSLVQGHHSRLIDMAEHLRHVMTQRLDIERQRIDSRKTLLIALSPEAALQRGYAILRSGNEVIQHIQQVTLGQTIEARLQDGTIVANVTSTEVQ